MSKHEEDLENDGPFVQVDIAYDDMLRNFNLGVHSDVTMTPKQIMDEIKELVSVYGDNPEQLFDQAEEIKSH